MSNLVKPKISGREVLARAWRDSQVFSLGGVIYGIVSAVWIIVKVAAVTWTWSTLLPGIWESIEGLVLFALIWFLVCLLLAPSRIKQDQKKQSAIDGPIHEKLDRIIDQTSNAPKSLPSSGAENPVDLYVEYDPQWYLVIDPHDTIRIVPLTESSSFPFDHVGFLTVPNLSTETRFMYGGPGFQSFARCKITNYSGKALFKIELKIAGQFNEFVQDESSTPGSGSWSKPVQARNWIIEIDHIDPGPEASYIFFLQNQARAELNVTVSYPLESTAQSSGADRRALKIDHKHPPFVSLQSCFPETVPPAMRAKKAKGESTKGALYFEQIHSKMPATADGLPVLDPSRVNPINLWGLGTTSYGVSDRPEATRCRVINDSDDVLLNVEFQLPITFTDMNRGIVTAQEPYDDQKSAITVMPTIRIARLGPHDAAAYEFYVRNHTDQFVRVGYPTEAQARKLDGTPEALNFRYADDSSVPICPYQDDKSAQVLKKELLDKGILEKTTPSKRARK